MKKNDINIEEKNLNGEKNIATKSAKKKEVLSPVESAKLYVERSEMLRYRNNRFAYYFAMLSICVMVAAFCTVYGYIASVTMMTGIDILLNIVALLVTFMTAEGVKVYSKKWGFISFGVAAWHIIHIYYPIILHSELMPNSTNPVLDTMRMTVVIILNIIAAALLVVSGIVTLIRGHRLRKFLKGEITVDSVLEGNK